jgi:peptidoglycan/xylan/chitin deacetylase (PgdA/CDA1 family)
LPSRRTSTPSWLVPPPVRRLRALLREIQRTVRETHQQAVDGRRQTVEALEALGARLDELEALTHRQVGLRRKGAARPHATQGGVASRPRQAVVLAYHRIAEPTTDPFTLSVTPEQFGQHLEVLCGLGGVLPIAELAECLADDRPPDRCFAVTFDDGYADNLHTAKPILERYGAPATVLLATGLLDGTPFWWDELAHLILDDTSAGRVSLEVNGATRSWSLHNGERRRTFDELWELLRMLDHDQRRKTLAALYSQLGPQPLIPERSLRENEIEELVRGGLIGVGAHTITHPLLTRLDDPGAREEIIGSKRWLEARVGSRVTAFSYPYGAYGARDIELVRQAGFEIAFSTAHDTVNAGCHPLEVPRVTIGNWDASEFERILANLGAARTRSLTMIDFGDLRRVDPVSENWGFDRGTPIDRHYVERFIERRSHAISGHVLEIGDPIYTTAFGGNRVSQCDVLEVTGGAVATYRCRLEDGDEIPSETFDCVICTQVLQYIYGLRGALSTLHRVLRPGGRLLLTVPAITPTHEGDQYGDAWHWSFTAASISRLCAESFGDDALEVEIFGNVLAASSFLYGLAASDLTPEELEHVDPDYVVIVGVEAAKT